MTTGSDHDLCKDAWVKFLVSAKSTLDSKYAGHSHTPRAQNANDQKHGPFVSCDSTLAALGHTSAMISRAQGELEGGRNCFTKRIKNIYIGIEPTQAKKTVELIHHFFSLLLLIE